MWPIKTILYFLFFWVTCLAALIDPIWGVVNYILAYQTNPTSTWWGQPLAALGIRFSFLAAIFTVIGFITGRKRVPKVSPSISLWEVGLFFIFLAAVANTMIGIEYGLPAKYAFEKFWKMMLFVLILGRLATTRTNFRIVLWTLVLGSMYVGWDAYTAPPDSFAFGRLERIGGPDFSTTSGTSAHLSAMLPLIGAVFLTVHKLRWKATAAFAGALTVNAIVLCRTRSAFVGLLIGGILAVLLAPKARRYRIHALLLAGAIAAFTLTDGYFWNRMATMTDRDALQKDMATINRTQIWLTSYRILSDHPLGVGLGNFERIIGQYDYRYHKRSSHNTVIKAFVELGIHGGLLFLSLMLGSIWMIFRSSKLADATADPVETKVLCYGCFISLITYLVTGLGTERLYCESFWWTLALPLGLYRLVHGEARQVRHLFTAPYPVDDGPEESSILGGVMHAT